MNGFLGSTVLEVAMGVACVYLLLGLCCLAINECVAAILRTRAKLLRQGIDQLLVQKEGLSPTNFAEKFYQHPLVRQAVDQQASYLPSRTFSQVILDLTNPASPSSSNSYYDLDNAIRTMPPSDLRVVLISCLQSAPGSVQGARQAIERWYGSAMDRVSGRYKRTVQTWTLVFATIFTVSLNVDTLRIARRLWIAPVLRSQMEQAARNPAPSNLTVNYPNPDEPSNPQVSTPVETSAGRPSTELTSIVGWESFVHTPMDWFQQIIGWLLTIFAVSVAAGFLFDVLGRFAMLRYAEPPPLPIVDMPETSNPSLS